MTITNPTRRRVLRDVFRAATIACAVMLGISTWTVIAGGSTPLAAATAGTATLDPASGASATDFAVALPAGAACSGNSASDNFRVQSYMVPGTVDPATLTFNSGGPVPEAGQFRTPLIAASGDPYVDGLTSVPAGGGPGLVTGLPLFNYALFLPGEIPGGTYNVGIACTQGLPSPTQLDKFWNARIDVTAVETGITWAGAVDPGTTTTTTGDPGTTTTTGDPGTTTTTAPGDTTTTTVGDGSTTTTAPGGSTTTLAGGSGGSSFTGGNPASPSVASTVGQLPYTGNSPWSLVIWGALLVVFGRMAMLLGRKPRVKTPPG
jgi:hypothetical protein